MTFKNASKDTPFGRRRPTQGTAADGNRAIPRQLDRRRFMQSAAAGLASGLAAPAIVTAKKGNGPVVIGTGEYRYEVHHDCVQLPSKFTWQTTHNVAVDKAGNLYVIHEGVADQKDHPAIFVFDANGDYIRSFGSEYQGGGHGLEVRDEGGTEFLYVTGYQQVKMIGKYDLLGEQVWTHFAPMQAGGYADGENTNPQQIWGRDRFMPTNFAFHPDGGFYVADGYGSHRIHRYDKEGVWMSVFGKHGSADGEFNLPHGLWIDDRGEEPTIVVTDRANSRLQWFTLEGSHLKTMNGFLLPANGDILGDLLLIPDLKSRITLLGKDNNVVAQLGDDPAWREEVLANDKAVRRDRSRWKPGKFVHPHDACFTPNGDIYVAEWVGTGRISKLIHRPAAG